MRSYLYHCSILINTAQTRFSWTTDDEIVHSTTDECETTPDEYQTLVAHLHSS